MVARASYRDVIADGFGNRLSGAMVEVRNPGTSTPIAGPLYADGTSATTLGNPLTADSRGYFELFLAAAQTVDIYVTAPGYNPLTVPSVAVAVLTTVDGALVLDGTITLAKMAASALDAAAGTASLRSLGTSATQAAAGNHAHAHSALTSVGANDHHAQAHALGGADHTGTLALSQLAALASARAYNNANLSIGNNAWTFLMLNSERSDTDTIHDTSSSTSRLTCKTAGLYLAIGQLQWAANGTGTRGGRIILNSATILVEKLVPTAGAGQATGLVLVTLYPLAVNDYLELAGYQDSGGALNVLSAGNLSPEFMLVRLGA
jgi:hypothetical protein